MRVTDLHAALIRLVPGTRYHVRGNGNAMAYNAESGPFSVTLPTRETVTIEQGGHCSLPTGTDHELFVPNHVLRRVQRLEAPFQDASRSNDSGSVVFAASISASTNPLPDIVPDIVHLTRSQMKAAGRLDLIFQLLQDHASRKGRVGLQIASRLAEIIAIALIDHVLQELKRDGMNAGAGVADPQLRRVLEALHETPEQDWSLDTLARHGGLSRSVLAERFKTVVGQSPIDYLTRVRMARASRMLQANETSIATIAFEVGYQSDASFHKAFKRMMGMSPSEYRQSGGARSPKS